MDIQLILYESIRIEYRNIYEQKLRNPLNKERCQSRKSKMYDKQLE